MLDNNTITPKKRHRFIPNTNTNTKTAPFRHSLASIPNGFNDPNTADVILRLYIDQSSSPLTSSSSPSLSDNDTVFDPSQEYQIYLHSSALKRSKYFGALLSDRWNNKKNDDQSYYKINFGVMTSSMTSYVTVLEMLYCDENEILSAIENVSVALEILPIALELLFEECVSVCVRYLEAVPWTEDEESSVLSMLPLLKEDEKCELLGRVNPVKKDVSEEMLHGLILSAVQSHPNMAFAKAFVAKLLREFSCRVSARRVLEDSFRTSLKVVKESLEEYSSPDFRGGDHNETEAIQRLNLHTAMTNGRHLLWLIERMIELRVADVAVKEWSEQGAFTADLQRAFRDDAWRNIVPGLPAVVLRCTCRLANAVAAGVILVPRQVRYFSLYVTLKC